MQNSSFPKQLEGRGCGSIRSVSFSTKTWNIEHKKRVKSPPPHPDRGSRQSCAWSTAKFIHYFKRQNPSFFKHNSSLSMQNSSSLLASGSFTVVMDGSAAQRAVQSGSIVSVSIFSLLYYKIDIFQSEINILKTGNQDSTIGNQDSSMISPAFQNWQNEKVDSFKHFLNPFKPFLNPF